MLTLGVGGALVAALIAPASAQTYILDIGDEVRFIEGGVWAKTFPDDGDGWYVLHANDGDFMLHYADADFNIDPTRDFIAGTDFLTDSAVTRCPDGGFLHVASVNLTDHNDSAYAIRYDREFNKYAEGWLAKSHASRVHNDMIAHCSEALEGAMFKDHSGNDAVWMHVDQDAAPAGEIAVSGGINSTGASMVYEPETDSFVAVSFNFNQSLYFFRLDRSLSIVEDAAVQAVSGDLQVYWPQAMLRVGDLYVLAHMVYDPAIQTNADSGNVWLQVIDRDWNVLETHQVTADEGEANMRPHLSRRGDTVVLSYDRETEGRLRPLTIDVDAFGVEIGVDTAGGGGDGGDGGDGGSGDGGDGGSGDGGSGGDTASPEGVAAEGGCGCTSRSSPGRDDPMGALALLFMVGVAARQRRDALS